MTIWLIKVFYYFNSSQTDAKGAYSDKKCLKGAQMFKSRWWLCFRTTLFRKEINYISCHALLITSRFKRLHIGFLSLICSSQTSRFSSLHGSKDYTPIEQSWMDTHENWGWKDGVWLLSKAHVLLHMTKDLMCFTTWTAESDVLEWTG